MVPAIGFNGLTDMAGNEASYSIYAVSEPPTSGQGILNRIFWPQGKQHSFLMLVEEQAGGGKKPLAELHFSGKDSNGKFVNAGSRLFNMMAAVADMLGVEGAFRKAASGTGLKKRLYPIKGVRVGARSDFAQLVKFGAVTGTPANIMFRWNRACAAAVIINNANLLFTALSRLRMTTPCQITGISFASLCRAQQRIAQRLYETSRVLDRKTGGPKFRQPAPV